MPGTTPPNPYAEWADLFEAMDALYDDLPSEAQSILDSKRTRAVGARNVSDCIAEQLGG